MNNNKFIEELITELKKITLPRILELMEELDVNCVDVPHTHVGGGGNKYEFSEVVIDRILKTDQFDDLIRYLGYRNHKTIESREGLLKTIEGFVVAVERLENFKIDSKKLLKRIKKNTNIQTRELLTEKI